MEKLLKFAVRFFIYFCIILPLLTNVFGGGWFGGIIGFVLAVIIMVACEITGAMAKLIKRILSFTGKAMRNQSSSLANTLGEAIAPVETAIVCNNCGTQVTLKNGQGKCPGCDSIFN